MISIKKYLDSDEPGLSIVVPERDELSSLTMECYRSALLSIGKVAVQITPGLGADLEKSMRGLDHRLSIGYSPESLKRTEQQVEVQLQEWGERTAGQFKAQADEVKELLIAMAKTAESVGARDQGYASQFAGLTSRLERIADLSDLTKIRSSLVERVAELKTTVDQMTRDNQQLVAQLRAEVSTYETRLKSVEDLVLKDPLTDLANRRSIEERIRWNIEYCQEFCVAMIDLDHFKQINDQYGHLAGDETLKQFARELQLNSRSTDLVGRWGGDEFIIVLSCNLKSAKMCMERVREWVLGNYTLRGDGDTSVVVQIDASIGAAEWRRGETMQQLIAEADADMYLDKKRSRQKAS
jgi:diguanylate cyclase (GGDEF)-like protein